MNCPRCDGQGDIYKAKIKNLGTTLYICDECEACWEEGVPIELSTFQDLSTFLEQKGVAYIELLLEEQNYQWSR